MITVFRYTLAHYRGQILGWGIALSLYATYLVSFYDTLLAQREQLLQLMQSFPPELLAFFGGEVASLVTPQGYLTLEFFSYMPLIIGIFAILAGSGLLASDEEKGTLDLVLAHPVSRRAVFLGRLLAFAFSTAGILAITWLGFVAAMNWSTLDIGFRDMALPFLSLLGVLLLFGTLALLLSMLLPSRRLAATTAALLLVASFFITSLARIDENLETIAKLSPLNYYQSGEAILGLKFDWFVGLLAAAALFAILGWWRFQRRDIRVGGEGSWRWALPGRRSVAPSTPRTG